jgi:hypothetical protein
MKKLILISIFLLVINQLYAEITIKGDSRVRPRLDQVFDKDGKTVEDFYYMYWTRLWLDAQLTEGWYFNTKLAADGPGNFIGKFGDLPYDGITGWTGNVAAHSGNRGIVRFAEMHFGRNTETFGFSMGILPLSGLANPEYDLHFYPTSKSDIPYTIVNAASAAGFRGYYKIGESKVNVTLTVDNNTGNREVDGVPRDQYSLMAHYDMKLGELKVAPTLIYTSADKDLPSPMTLGANFGLPKLAGFTLSGGAYFTNQSVEDAVEYSGFMTHVKAAKPFGPGTFVGWMDYKTIDVDGFDDNVNTTLLWVMYKYVVYKSDVGDFSISPTFRRIMQTHGKTEYSRNKIELTMHINFK